jgi:hypothetical protein
MRFPSKVTTFNESILSKFPIVLKELRQDDLKPSELYKRVKKHVKNIKEFVEIIDGLYAINEIELLEGEVIHYVKKH